MNGPWYGFYVFLTFDYFEGVDTEENSRLGCANTTKTFWLSVSSFVLLCSRLSGSCLPFLFFECKTIRLILQKLKVSFSKTKTEIFYFLLNSQYKNYWMASVKCLNFIEKHKTMSCSKVWGLPPILSFSNLKLLAFLQLRMLKQN